MTPEQEEAAAEAVRQAIRFNRWYPAAHDAAVALWKAGTSGPAISAVMLDRFKIRKTKSAVIGRMYRHGLAFQGPRPHVDQAASARRNTGSGLPRAQMPPATLARVRERDAARDNARRHVARRPGPCEHCPINRGIQPGEAYTVYVGLDDDRDFFHERHCAVTPDECRAAMPSISAPPRPTTGTYGPDEIPF